MTIKISYSENSMSSQAEWNSKSKNPKGPPVGGLSLITTPDH